MQMRLHSGHHKMGSKLSYFNNRYPNRKRYHQAFKKPNLKLYSHFEKRTRIFNPSISTQRYHASIFFFFFKEKSPNWLPWETHAHSWLLVMKDWMEVEEMTRKSFLNSKDGPCIFLKSAANTF